MCLLIQEIAVQIEGKHHQRQQCEDGLYQIQVVQVKLISDDFELLPVAQLGGKQDQHTEIEHDDLFQHLALQKRKGT